MLRALHRWGVDVHPQPTWLDVPVPPDLLPLFGKTLQGPYDLTINHWDPSNLRIEAYAREMTRCAVAWSMWEFAPCPGPTAIMPDGREVKAKSGLVPHCERRSSLRKRLSLFDLVLGYDDVSVAALAPYTPKHVALAVLQGGYEPAPWLPDENSWVRDWDTADDFRFIMHGAMGSRKCPWTAVQAFNELKWERPEDFGGAKLLIHTTVQGVFPEMNNIFQQQKIKVYMDAWPHETLRKFYFSGHCLVLPSRGEGKNLPALEMQTTGGVPA
jgi:hypothetical protein